ncbi:ABC transporter permease [Ancylobacter sp. 6x-1]|uniref:ABC transporter permease n=1 Tax=Ancylobacter crimeensis TaxID=2579147 RepID=A0ABT0DDW3_9HYPH|nr:ABC transporter permease [Ancylobacter crimeensis]MCK0198162.1 ABC transporter permease [Ancylobacter crimeensis]
MDKRLDLSRFISRDNNILQLLVITALIFALMSWLEPNKFLRYYNFESISFIFPELGIVAIAMMLAMLTGGIDLSVIGIANLAGILAGVFFTRIYPGDPSAGMAGEIARVAAGVMLALGVGLIAGTLNGLLIAKGRITPILATLGTGQMFTGLCMVLTGGPAIVGFPAYWGLIGNGKLFGIAVPLLLFLAVAVLIAVMLTKTPFGLNLFLIGTNPRAAVFAGLKTERMVLWSYMLSGTLAALAGIVLSGRTNAAKSDYGNSYLLQAVLICVLGGTNPAGGRGTVLGIAIAVIALMLLASGFQMMRFSNHLIDFIWGGFLLLVMVLNAFRNRE